MPRLTLIAVALSSSALLSNAANAAPTLVNPAAAYCIETGGFYGIRDGADGKIGICVLPDGSELDAWTYLREARVTPNQIANPAAVFCETQGGSYDLNTGNCTLPNGEIVDAWTLLRESNAQSAQLANPSAIYCIEQGGTYRVEQSETGAVGICTLPDGSEENAWSLFRASRNGG